MKIGCVVLAAGNARRFGSNKLQVQVDGESLIRRALETVPSGLVTVLVSQYPEILSLAGEYGFEAVLNDQPDLGLSRSVRLGLERLTDCGGVLFLVADQPWLKRDSVEALAALWAQHPAKIAAMAHGGVRGNPCLFPAQFYPELLALNGDRGGSAVIYFKQSEHIEDLLTTIGAPAAAMDIMTAKVDKEIRNGANRAMNCDMANVNKTIDAALEQKNAIQRLQENGRLERLPEKLRQTALLRLQYPEMSLSQLAEKCAPPVTKSCMNHRMRKLLEEAKKL